MLEQRFLAEIGKTYKETGVEDRELSRQLLDEMKTRVQKRKIKDKKGETNFF